MFQLSTKTPAQFEIKTKKNTVIASSLSYFSHADTSLACPFVKEVFTVLPSMIANQRHALFYSSSKPWKTLINKSLTISYVTALLEYFDLIGGWFVIMRNYMQFSMSISLREILRIILGIIGRKNLSIILSQLYH